MSTIITALTPNQVNDELHKMQAFIKKEAEEKAKEIQLKANQEYEIEKASLVRTETNNIDLAAEVKRKKIILKQQIIKSTISNKTRLKVLSTREEVLNEIFSEAREKLRLISCDNDKYQHILRSLILESMLRLLESKVIIKCREIDLKLVEEIIKEVQEEYKEKSQYKKVEVLISNEYLSKDIFGGVVVSDVSGRIKIDNTLEERLKLLGEEALPAIRVELFGPSETRKFYD